MTQDELKAAVGRAAIDYLVEGTIVGVGSGQPRTASSTSSAGSKAGFGAP